MISHISRILLVFSLALMFSIPRLAVAAKSDVVIVEKPSAVAMTGDLLVARPVMLGITVVGTAIWLVSLPFSLMGGNSMQAADTLVVQPAYSTFVRCLGCKNPGYKRDVEVIEGSEEE